MARTANRPAQDGAKPGAEAVTPTDKHAFDADGRAKSREDAPVTVGETVYHRRRKNWKVTRELRNLLRKQERAGVRQERIRKQIDALAADADEAQLHELEDQIDQYGDEADEAAYEMIVLLLRDSDGASPDINILKETLDVEDAGDLAAALTGGGAEDPTQETPSSSG
jgi:hypothetical protein